MGFDLSHYSSEVQSVLALDGNGGRPMPLAEGKPIRSGLDALSGKTAQALFPGTYSPEGALSGLYLYFCGYDQAHGIAQEMPTAEGSFWHGILHRQEPDAANASYWFRRVGQHPVFPQLRDCAVQLGFSPKDEWDPLAFIEYCETARKKPGSREERTAMAIQLAEWQLLFDYCARPSR